jgi:hypothetical protein
VVGQLGTRQRLLVGLIAFGVLVGVATATVAQSSSSPGRTVPSITWETADPSVAPPPPLTAGVLGFGVAYGDTLTWKNDKDLARALQDANDLGATWIRVDLSWNDIQPESSGDYLWGRFDRIAEGARAHRLNVLATIAYTPAWARQSACMDTPSCAPADPAAFAAFAAKAAARYAPVGVHTWEVWNEPNYGFWTPRADPAGYERLLADTSAALRKADSRAFVVLGGLAAVPTDSVKGALSPYDFLSAVFKLGGGRAVDAVGYHPYNGANLPSAYGDGQTPFDKITGTKDSVAAALAKYGSADTPIWITETGVSTNAPGPAADGTSYQPAASHVTEAYQAQIAANTVTTLAANPHVATMFWYSDQDSAQAQDYTDLGAFFGLRRYDGTARPAFGALKTAISAYMAAH